MPREALAMGAAAQVLPMDRIANAILISSASREPRVPSALEAAVDARVHRTLQ
jgi:hypothetical protein